MRRIGVLAAATFGLVALGVAALGWLREPDPISATEAAEVTASALAEAGVAGARLRGDPSRGTYEPEPGERIEVWKTAAAVDGGTIVLWVAEDDAEPVYLDDRGPSGATQLLTDDQFRALDAHHDNPARDRLVRENLVLTVAAGLVLAAAALLTIAGRLRSG